MSSCRSVKSRKLCRSGKHLPLCSSVHHTSIILISAGFVFRCLGFLGVLQAWLQFSALICAKMLVAQGNRMPSAMSAHVAPVSLSGLMQRRERLWHVRSGDIPSRLMQGRDPADPFGVRQNMLLPEKCLSDLREEEQCHALIL